MAASPGCQSPWDSRIVILEFNIFVVNDVPGKIKPKGVCVYVEWNRMGAGRWGMVWLDVFRERDVGQEG